MYAVRLLLAADWQQHGSSRSDLKQSTQHLPLETKNPSCRCKRYRVFLEVRPEKLVYVLCVSILCASPARLHVELFKWRDQAAFLFERQMADNCEPNVHIGFDY